MKQRTDALHRIKDRLLQRKVEMTSLLSSSTNEKFADDQIQDSGDEALSLTMENLKNSLEQNEIDELRLIDNALARIERGEYGSCIDCEEHISERRLENFPYAARCIVCQEDLEG